MDNVLPSQYIWFSTHLVRYCHGVSIILRGYKMSKFICFLFEFSCQRLKLFVHEIEINQWLMLLDQTSDLASQRGRDDLNG